MKQRFICDTSDVFKTNVYESGQKVNVREARLTVYRPRTNSKLIDSEPMTLDADGRLTFTLSAEHNSFADINYRAVISYVYNGAPGLVSVFYDVVRSRPAMVITDEDIAGELPQLQDNGWKVRGHATGGTDSSIIDAELKRFDSGYFTGASVYSLMKDETRQVTGFDRFSGTVFINAFSTPVASGEGYVLTRSYSKEIIRAFEKLEEKIVRLGKRPDLIADPYELRATHIYGTVAEVCKGLAKERGGLWWELWKHYEKKADDEFNGLCLKYFVVGSTRISRAEEGFRLSSIATGRG